MSAFAYLLPPLSGALAFLNSPNPVVRFHGLQSVALGLAWPLGLYLGSAISRLATNAAFAAGLLIWMTLLVTSARGRVLRLPVIGPFCARLAGITDAP